MPATADNRTRKRSRGGRAGAVGDRSAGGSAAAGAGLVGRVGQGRIGELQRARILGAMVELVRELGIGKVTVAHVVARSGVSRRTFYELFEDRDACFLAAVEHALGRLVERVAPAYAEGGPSWRKRIRGALAELLTCLEREPYL